MENIKNIPVCKSEEVEDAIYATADKINELVNELCKTLAHGDISHYGKVNLAIKVCEDSFPKQAYNRLNCLFEVRERAFKHLSSIVDRELAKK